MYDEKLARARQLIEQRDQIDQELRILFGESPQPKRGRRRKADNSASGEQLELGADRDHPPASGTTESS
jgi:hypothetical protein